MITMRDEDFVKCKHCNERTSNTGTRQCDSCWEERRSGSLDAAEDRIRELKKTLLVARPYVYGSPEANADLALIDAVLTS